MWLREFWLSLGLVLERCPKPPKLDQNSLNHTLKQLLAQGAGFRLQGFRLQGLRAGSSRFTGSVRGFGRARFGVWGLGLKAEGSGLKASQVQAMLVMPGMLAALWKAGPSKKPDLVKQKTPLPQLEHQLTVFPCCARSVMMAPRACP